MWVLAGLALLQGCATGHRGSVPVVDAGAPVSERGVGRSASGPAAAPPRAAVSTPDDAGVVVMVPQESRAPIQALPLPSQPPVTATPGTSGGGAWTPSRPAPSGVPSPSGSSVLSADEQLDGPVLALLTTASRQQGAGDLGGAASSLERALRIAPREPQVLYRLAQVRLDQGDAAQAEQLSRRALGYAGGRPALQASLWELIAQARERQGDANGAAQARQRARVNL